MNLTLEESKAVRLSPHFTLYEFCRSEAAQGFGIVNVPTEPEIIDNLRHLCASVLEPLRELAGCPLKITSGYRCEALNRIVSSNPASQHVKGEAADTVPIGFERTAFDLFLTAREARLPYDQAIYEMIAGRKWVHFSARRGENRMMALEITEVDGERKVRVAG